MKTIFLSLVFLFTATLGILRAEGNAVESKETVSLSNYVIKGSVVDCNNESLAGATVIVNDQKVYTDLDGNFIVTNLQSDKCEISVSMISYEPKTIVVSASKTKDLTIKL